MHFPIWILIFAHQSDACLDILVRAINEIFSPLIETGNERIENPHDVDELTNYYKIDELGNLELNENSIDPLLMCKHCILSNDDSNQQLNSNDPQNVKIPCDGTECENPIYVDEDEIDEEGSRSRQQKFDSNNFISGFNYERPYYHRNDRFTPGKRPLVDFIIKILEMFQLTSKLPSPKVYPAFRKKPKKFRYYTTTKIPYPLVDN